MLHALSVSGGRHLSGRRRAAGCAPGRYTAYPRVNAPPRSEAHRLHKPTPACNHIQYITHVRTSRLFLFSPAPYRAVTPAAPRPEQRPHSCAGSPSHPPCAPHHGVEPTLPLCRSAVTLARNRPFNPPCRQLLHEHLVAVPQQAAHGLTHGRQPAARAAVQRVDERGAALLQGAHGGSSLLAHQLVQVGKQVLGRRERTECY